MGELCQHDPSDCSDVDGMATVPDIWDCAGFSLCQCGIKVSSSRCPPGLWYDHSVQGCIRMSVVEDKCTGLSDDTTETSTSADPCLSDPCQNGGVCQPQSDGSFVCDCQNGCPCVDLGVVCEIVVMDCTTVADGNTVPDPDDCAAFHACFNGAIAFSPTCPTGNWYNNSTQSCLGQHIVEPTCSSSTATALVTEGTTTVTQSTMEAGAGTIVGSIHPTTTPDPCASDSCQNGGTCVTENDSFICICPAECVCADMGDFCEKDPADCSVGPEYRSTLNDCQRYIRCVNGMPFENSCSNFTYFDPQTYACNHEFLVEPKCIAGLKPLTTQAATPTTTTAELTGIAATTSKPTTVSVGSEPTQTSTIPPTTVYDACASRPCQNGGTCVTQANDTFVCHCPSSCVCVDMGEFCEYDPFDCSSGNEFRSHPDNCQLYIRCVHSLPNILTCANGTIYDPQYASCNFPFLVEPKCEAGWSEDTTPVATAATTVLISTPIVTSSQPTVSEGSVPTQTTTLPATTLFDPCACQNGGTCLPQANDTFTCECPDVCNCVNVGIFCEYDPDPFDCTSPGEYRSHPDDCQLYIRCVNNNPAVLSCGNGTYYDPQIKSCNFPYVVEDKCLNGWVEPGGPDITQSGPDTTQGGPDTTQGGPDTTQGGPDTT